MNIAALIISVFACTIISFQDFKYRAISINSLILFFIGAVAYALSHSSNTAYPLIVNLIFLLLVYTVLRIHFLIKKGVQEPFINHYLGLGDIYVFLITCFYYSTYNFILFVMMTSVCSLIIGYLNRHRNNKIPLAGIMTLFHIPIIIYFDLISVNLIQTDIYR